MIFSAQTMPGFLNLSIISGFSADLKASSMSSKKMEEHLREVNGCDSYRVARLSLRLYLVIRGLSVLKLCTKLKGNVTWI